MEWFFAMLVTFFNKAVDTVFSEFIKDKWKRVWQKASRRNRVASLVVLAVIAVLLGSIVYPYFSTKVGDTIRNEGNGNINVQNSTVNINQALGSNTEYKQMTDHLNELKDMYQLIPIDNVSKREEYEQKIGDQEILKMAFEDEVKKLARRIENQENFDKKRLQLAKSSFEDGKFTEARTTLSWGPDRTTYTIEYPADYVTFNSITNNPNYGDERNFITIKDLGDTDAGGWVDEITVQNDAEYYVRMYVHNNSAENLNLLAKNVVARFHIPEQTATHIAIDGYLTSSNASPEEVWDQVVFRSIKRFNIVYVPGSASLTNNIFTSGISIPDSVVDVGATLGYAQLDGNIPGCFQYTGYVIFKVKAIISDSDLQTKVRIHGADDSDFKENVTVHPGEQIDFQIHFKNTGGTQLEDVVVKDILPEGVTYVASTTYFNSSEGTKKVADGITTVGANIGGYIPDGDVYIKFTAQVPHNDELPSCGKNTLNNVAKATTVIGSVEDVAVVTVTKMCDMTSTTTSATQSKFNISNRQMIAILLLGFGSLSFLALYYYRSSCDRLQL